MFTENIVSDATLQIKKNPAYYLSLGVLKKDKQYAGVKMFEIFKYDNYKSNQ